MADSKADLWTRATALMAVAVLLVAGALGSTKTGRARHRREKRFSEERTRRPNFGVHLASGFSGVEAHQPRPTTRERDVDLTAYKDLGSWVDIYDRSAWNRPAFTVQRLRRRGVRTIFLQTSNYGSNTAIFKRRQTGRFLTAAHKRGMKVVAWYVPSFHKPKVDYSRSRAAIVFEENGHAFDSFGLDIEATVIGNIWLRNRRLIALSKRLRRLAGPRYPLAAITPDPVKALYWTKFPYVRVNRIYDVFVPMGYFSFRAHGYRGVKRYTIAGIRNIRRASRDRNAPIHVIGGIGGETKGRETKGFVDAVRAKGVLGASYYDYLVTAKREWGHLEKLSARRSPSERNEATKEAPQPASPRPVGAPPR